LDSTLATMIKNATMTTKHSRAVNVFVIMLCQGFQTVSAAAIALFLPAIRQELGLSFTQAGTLSAAGILVYALMQIPAGYLADRYGLKRLFFIGALGTTLLCVTFGFVTVFWQAVVNQMVAGAFHAFLFQSGLALLASWFGAERRATAMGLSLVAIFSGQLVVNAFGPVLVAYFNWRSPFMLFGSAGIWAAFLYLWLGRELAYSGARQKLRIGDALELFRHPFMWLCGVIQYIRLGVMQGILFWLPSFLLDEQGLPLQVTGFIIAIRTLLIAPSTILGGYISDRLRNPTAVMALSLIILALTTAGFTKVSNLSVLMALIFVNAIFVQSYFGPLFSIPVDRYGTKMLGTLSGFGNFYANLGGLTFTYVLGLLKDRTGYFEAGFNAIATACVLGLVFTFLLDRMRRASG